MTGLPSETEQRVRLVCGEIVRAVRIVYGRPTEETAARARAGEFRLGGCVITGDDPKWACPKCGEPLGHPGWRDQW